jgi:SAM-dependent methyltransferase
VSESEDRYRGLSGRRYHEGKRAIPDAAYPWVARARALKLTPFVRLEDVVLEYGVGYGWNLAALPCRRRIGFDVAEAVEAQVRQHGIEFFGDEAQLPAAAADVLLCHHTLEHVLRPPAALKSFSQWLAPAGRLMVVVPWERERGHRRFRRGEANHHLYSWSPQSLGNLVEDCGYRVSQAGTAVYGYDRFAAVWANRLRVGETGFRFLRRALQTLRPLRECYVVATLEPAGGQIAG